MSRLLSRSSVLFRQRRIFQQQTQRVIDGWHWRWYSDGGSSASSHFVKGDFPKTEETVGSSGIYNRTRDQQDLAASTKTLRLNEGKDEKVEEQHESKRNTEVVSSSSSPTSSSASWLDKVVYSSYLEKFAPPRGYRQRLKERYEAKVRIEDRMIKNTTIMPPVALKYLVPEDDESIEEMDPKRKSSQFDNQNVESSEELLNSNEESVVQFPYKVSKTTEFLTEDDLNDIADERIQQAPLSPSLNQTSDVKLESVADRLRRHQVDPNSVLEADESENMSSIFEAAAEVCIANAGTPDPSVPPSNIPCGGCGALLHCQDQSIPGYISSERFKNAKKNDLRADVCYRCSVLEAHQATLNVNVKSEEYPRIVSKIREQFAMVLLLVDLTDFPCSIWPGLLDIIGTRRPILLVGNKVDLLPQDSADYLQRVLDGMIKCVVDVGMLDANIIHTALVSAKTGYGVEDLITKIFDLSKGKGDVFIMGCTNVGKSSLFNSFLQSDLCKPQVCDLVQKATISQWPGTTLNLLKFPMTSPSGWKKYLRERRLDNERSMIMTDQNERAKQFKETNDPEFAVLTGHIGKTFVNEQKQNAADSAMTVSDIFSVNPRNRIEPKTERPGQWNPNEPTLQGHWVYDTPGAVNTNQILDLLTLPELMQSLPKSLIHPRSYYVKPGMSVFIGGLARIDFIDGTQPIRYTLFSNASLPVTMCLTEDADAVYEKALGTKILGVPSGGKERLSQFPDLKSKEVHLKGVNHRYSCADLVLSSIGWVAVTAGNQHFSLSVHTPAGKGIFVRQPALLPHTINFKGKRARGTYSYQPHRFCVMPIKLGKNRSYKVKKQSFYD